MAGCRVVSPGVNSTGPGIRSLAVSPRLLSLHERTMADCDPLDTGPWLAPVLLLKVLFCSAWLTGNRHAFASSLTGIPLSWMSGFGGRTARSRLASASRIAYLDPRGLPLN